MTQLYRGPFRVFDWLLPGFEFSRASKQSIRGYYTILFIWIAEVWNEEWNQVSVSSQTGRNSCESLTEVACFTASAIDTVVAGTCKCSFSINFSLLLHPSPLASSVTSGCEHYFTPFVLLCCSDLFRQEGKFARRYTYFFCFCFFLFSGCCCILLLLLFYLVVGVILLPFLIAAGICACLFGDLNNDWSV